MASIYLFMEVIALFSVLGIILYKFLTRNFNYWENKNVPYHKPLILFGNYFEIMTFRSTVTHYLAELYNQFDTPYFGIFALNKPVLVIKDLELIKSVLSRDFDQFCDRTIKYDETCDTLFLKSLVLANNPKWKAIRAKVTPIFTSAKLKEMLHLINIVSLNMNTYLQNNVSKGSIEAKEICAKYTIDVITTCAFGLEGNCFKNENSEFRLIGRRVFDFSWEGAFRQMSYFMLPEIVKIFKFSILNKSIAEFFRDVFWKTINHREQTKTKRHDLLDTLIQLKNQQDVSLDFTGDMVVAQAAMFFIAGFETTSTTMAFTLYELTLSPTIQNKARKEVTEAFLRHGNFTYEAIQDMKYLHMIICETLRKYPALPILNRVCVENYKVPDSDLILEKGTSVVIPVWGLHYDSKFYSEPNKYDPERFSEENKRNIPSFSFLPFGEGPRNCIGERFGLLVAKLGLARILLEYELGRSVDTPLSIEFATKSFVLASKTGLPIRFKKIVLDRP